jgi:REP element-mobilizing transposase RayT
MSFPFRYPLPRNQRLDSAVYATAGQSCFFRDPAAPGSAPFARPELAEITCSCLLAQRSKSACQLEVYCVMPDHLHLIVAPMREGASSLTFVDRFKGWSGYMMRRAGWTGLLWQARSYDHVLRRDEDKMTLGGYILHNPVRRALSATPEEYPWSGIPDPITEEDLEAIRAKE